MHHDMQTLHAAAASLPGMRSVRRDDVAFDAHSVASALPDGVTRWILMAALRGAARRFGLTAPMLRLLEHYMDLSYEADWAKEAEPIIPVPLCEVAEALGRTERQIRNIERKLATAGFLVWRDAANHHRKGRRCGRSGRLIWAYGPSLAPMRARALEILSQAKQERSDRQEARKLRLAIAALRRRLHAMVVTVSSPVCGENGPEAIVGADQILDVAAFCAAVRRTLDRMPPKSPAGTPLSALRARHRALRVLHERFVALIADVEKPDGPRQGGQWRQLDQRNRPMDLGPKISAKGEKTGARIPIQADQSMNGSCSHREASTPCRQVRFATGSRDPNDQRRPDHPDRRYTTRCGGPGTGRGVPKTLDPHDVARAAGLDRISLHLVEAALSCRHPTWQSVVAASAAALPGLGLSHDLWAKACATLGRRGAALCTILVGAGLMRKTGPASAGCRNQATPRSAGWEHRCSAQPDIASQGPRPAAQPLAPIRSPDRYFAELIGRAERGQLDLAASFFALAARAETGRADGDRRGQAAFSTFAPSV